MEFQYLEAASDDASGSEASDGEASPRGGGDESNAGVASSVPAASAASAAAGALRGWRAWGGGALSALSSLQLESVQKLATEALATVRRDVGEFSEALTADAAELAAAGAAAADEALPELRATAAGLQEKLEVVGGGLETAGASLLANIAQVRDAIIAENDANVRGRRGRSAREGGAGGAARPAAAPSLDKLVAAMQRDSATYCDEPADTAAFAAFQAGFSLEGRAPEVAEVLRKNAFMAELHSRIVPLVVDDVSFWTRYFFRLQALTEAHTPRSSAATPRGSQAEGTAAGESAGAEGAAAANAADIAAAAAPPPEAAAAPSAEPPAAAEAAAPSPPQSPPPPDAPAAAATATPRSGSDSVGSEADMRSDVSGSWSVVSADAAAAATPPPARNGAADDALDAGPTPSPSPLPASLARGGDAEEEELDEDWGMS